MRIENAKRGPIELNFDDDITKVIVYRIKPRTDIQKNENAVHGIAIRFQGFTEKMFSDVVYNASPKDGETDEPAQDICHVNGICKRVAKLVLGGEPVVNEKGYPIRILVSVIDEGATVEQLKSYLKNELIPDLVAYTKTTKYTLKPEQVPVIGDTTEFIEFDKWHDIMNSDDIEYVMKSHFCTAPLGRFHQRDVEDYEKDISDWKSQSGTDKGEEPIAPEPPVVMSFGNFLKSSKDNVYSC
jgi:hypothetical protein